LDIYPASYGHNNYIIISASISIFISVSISIFISVSISIFIYVSISIFISVSISIFISVSISIFISVSISIFISVSISIFISASISIFISVSISISLGKRSESFLQNIFSSTHYLSPFQKKKKSLLVDVSYYLFKKHILLSALQILSVVSKQIYAVSKGTVG